PIGLVGSRQGFLERRRRMDVNVTRRKPLPAFFLFMEEHRPYLQRLNPHWTAAKTAIKLGEKWHSQPQSVKDRYKEQAHRCGQEPGTARKGAQCRQKWRSRESIPS
uniref:HMG box domain-containing protein n=1 Tax=Gallus gallus TaxID=9031 RepID=A0A8V0YZV8_CHICK